MELNEDVLYYFTALHQERYHTVFVSWLRRDLIKAFEQLDGISSYAHIVLNIGENVFISNVGVPLYLLNYENDDIFEFAGDHEELELYPSGDVPDNLDLEPVIDFPTFFEKGVEPLLEFKLDNRFWAQKNGLWIPLDI